MVLKWKFGEVHKKVLDVIVVNPGIIIGGGFWKSGSSGSLFNTINKGMKLLHPRGHWICDVKDVVHIMISSNEFNHYKNEAIYFSG